MGMAAVRIEDLNAAADHLAFVTDPELRQLPTFHADFLCFVLALTDSKQGRYDRIHELLEYVLDAGVPSRRAAAYRILAGVSWRLDADLATASQLLEQSVIADPPDESGLWWHDAMYRAGFLLKAGRPEESMAFAVPGLEQQRRAATAKGPPSNGVLADLGISLTTLGRALVCIDRPEESAVAFAEAQTLLPGRWYAIAYLCIGKAELAVATHDPREAHRHLDEAEKIAQQLTLRPAMLEIAAARVRAHHLEGKERDAVAVLATATHLAENLQHRSDLNAFERLRDDLGLPG